MASFARSTFPTLSYSAFRPTYPPRLYQLLLTYHTTHPQFLHPANRNPHTTLLDLGTGHATIPRALSPHFTAIHATDPSVPMLAEARRLTPASEYPGITFHLASAESLPFLPAGSVDMVTAGQAAHWFDYRRVWPELARVVRRGGTVGFWGYTDIVFPAHLAASALLRSTAYAPGGDGLGDYWPQPGRSIVQDKLRAVVPPEGEWDEVERVEYEPQTPEQGECLMRARWTLGTVEDYIRTWSCVFEWVRAHPGRRARRDGGEGDVVDELMVGMVGVEEGWQREGGEGWREVEVDVEWGSGVLLARRR